MICDPLNSKPDDFRSGKISEEIRTMLEAQDAVDLPLSLDALLAQRSLNSDHQN